MFGNIILKHKRIILVTFIVMALASAAMMLYVDINYDLADFLPNNVPSALALKEIEENFEDNIPNLNIFLEGASIPEAVTAKEKLKKITGVSSVLWLDDVEDIYQPLSMMDQDMVDAWYQEEGALLLLAGDTEICTEIIDEIKDLLGEDVIMSGPLLNQATLQSLTTGEVSQIIFMVIPLVMVVLFISTSSWFEPILFLITIAVAILLNEGTNIIMKDVSYVTQSTSAVLQLAVSMDYAVFLLHSFSGFRDEGHDVEKAMKLAMRESAPAVAASAVTTVFGFLALTLMKFQLGPNMGLVLAKGIFFSFLSVMILLPILAVYTTKIMDKTHHRSFLPSFNKFSRLVTKIAIPMALVFVFMIGPSFLAQQNNSFIYGSTGINTEDSILAINEKKIESIFGGRQQMVVIVPTDPVKEEKLSKDLKAMPLIDSVISFTETVGAQIPTEFLTESQLDTFQSNGKSRVILYGDTKEEGEEAFKLVEDIRDTAYNIYGDDYHFMGQNVVNYDLKDTVVKDGTLVNVAAIIAIGLVLLVTFRNFTLPLILLLTIEGAVWINLGMPYFLGQELNYIGFLIISSVQLGATVDYGILFASHYMRNRESLPAKEASRLTIENTAASILTPASILAIATLILWKISSNGIISELGLMLGRGALISATMVLLFLPALLRLFDKAVSRKIIKKAQLESIEIDKRGKEDETLN